MDFVAPIVSLHSFFESRALARPDEAALLACDAEGETVRSLTNRALRDEVVQKALWFKKAGLGQGSVVDFSTAKPGCLLPTVLPCRYR